MLDKKTVRQIATDYAKIVCQNFNPTMIVLFGSYVDGNPTADSDIDIAIVFDNFQGDWLLAATKLTSLTRKVSLYIEPHIMDKSDDPSGFLKKIQSTGELIYAA